LAVGSNVPEVTSAIVEPQSVRDGAAGSMAWTEMPPLEYPAPRVGPSVWRDSALRGGDDLGTGADLLPERAQERAGKTIRGRFLLRGRHGVRYLAHLDTEPVLRVSQHREVDVRSVVGGAVAEREHGLVAQGFLRLRDWVVKEMVEVFVAHGFSSGGAEPNAPGVSAARSRRYGCR
jgi:hypothetical protein